MGDNETFVHLIQIAREETEIRRQMLGILSLDAFNRKSALNIFIQEMNPKDAPREFVSAISSLLDDGVARRALEILNEDRGESIG